MILSVITINLNNCRGLERTIKSVLHQNFEEFEYLIIDGGSKDGSQELIARHVPALSYWVSEPDGGIYQAMNKGIRKAQGDYCLFLNSGDWLVTDDILAQVFSMHPTADLVAGDVYFYDMARQEVKWYVPSPDHCTAATLFGGTLPHQATFIRRELFGKVGLYNQQFRIASDWLFFLEALLVHGCSYQHVPLPIAYFSMDGISCDPAQDGLARREQLAILQERYPRFLPDYERLSSLEREAGQWQQSREYRVYQWLRRWGLIRAGVGVMRGVRFLKRQLRRMQL